MKFAKRLIVIAAAVAPLLSCVSTADFRKLEHRVNQIKAGGGGTAGGSVADLRSELETLRGEVSRIEGRLEVAEHQAQSALGEAQSARMDAARGTTGPVLEEAEIPPGAEAFPDGAAAPGPVPPGVNESAELAAYREGWDAWSRDDAEACIDRFGRFLQTHASSVYADDSAYFLADCYFKQGDFRNAVLRFDDVVRTYPGSDRASEALYRQGEALLRINREKAAETAFQRVLNEYPNSVRAPEARRQLALLGG